MTKDTVDKERFAFLPATTSVFGFLFGNKKSK